MKRAIRFLVVLAALLAATAFVQPHITTSCGGMGVSDPGCPTPW